MARPQTKTADGNRGGELLAVKMSKELAQEIRKRARADDRTVSSFLRRLLASAVGQQSEVR